MSPVREKFINILENLPYDIDKEILKKSTYEILQDVTQRYVDEYGTADLCENDIECIESLIGLDFHKKEAEKQAKEQTAELQQEQI